MRQTTIASLLSFCTLIICTARCLRFVTTNIRKLVCAATIISGIFFSCPAEAQSCFPDHYPFNGSFPGSSSGTISEPAGTTMQISWGYGSSGSVPSTATISMSGGGSFALNWGCSKYVQGYNYYTTAADNETYIQSWVLGWGAGGGYYRPVFVVASPMNFGPNDPSCSPCTLEGDPVNVGTGNLYETETDFVGAPSTNIELRRYYNSLALTSTALGINWRSTYDRSIYYSTGSSFAQLYRETGRIESFRLVSGVWAPDAEVRNTLTAVMMGSTLIGWQVVTPDDTTENYNMGGQLTSIVTRAGLATTLTYNAEQQLATVTGPFGHTLNYTYNASGNVATVTIPDGGVYTYVYDTHNNLISVTYPDTKIRQYTYTNTSYVNALTSIVDERGNVYASFAYDSAGRATSSQNAGGANSTSLSYSNGGLAVPVIVTDPNGNTHSYSFTAQFGVVKPTAVTGAQVASVGGKSFSYDSNGFIASKTDYNNNVTNYTHDARGNETSRTEAYGTSLARTISTTWHSTFHLPLSITEPNRTTTFTYDANGNMLTKTITAGLANRVWTYTYNASGEVLTVQDPNSNTTTYTYNTDGTLATISDALGNVTRFTSYDADGKPLSITDPNGLVTTLVYDTRGRLTSRTVGSEVASYTYDAAGNLTKVTRPDSSYLSYTYDNAHRLTAVADALGNSIAYTLDAAGNVTAKKIYDSSNTLKWTRAYTYDRVERLATEVGASSQTTTYSYDSNSNLTSISDPLGHAFSYTYDALNRRAAVVDPASHTTTYGYDTNDHLTSVTDPRNLVTSYTYTGLDNLIAVSSPDAGSTSKTYDSAGNVLTSTDATGNMTTYTYDALNRISTATYADGTTASWVYDQGTYGKGHLTTLTDVAGTTTWTYDIHGRVTQKQQTTGIVVLTTNYTYDSYGRLSTVTYPSGNSITLAYDSAGRVNSISSGGSSLVSAITYMPFGPVSGWTEGNGGSYSRTADQDGRITAIGISGTTSVPGTTTLSYTLDNASRITALTETGLANKSFSYDNLNRLTSFVNGSATTSYAYDVDSNRTSTSVSSGTTTYNYSAGSNRLSSLSGLASANYSYDADGHMTGDGANSWAYDARGRMASDTVSSVATSYGINALGQRITKSGAGVPPAGLNEFVYDTDGHLLGEYDGNGNALEETVWLGHLPVAVFTGTGISAASYYVNLDHLGAPHIITDISGNQVWTWDHLAFGDNVPNQNPSGLGIFNYNPRFPGQYADAESGLSYNMARDYNPGLGRYVESDPIGLLGGINTYGYVGENPVTKVDRFGFSSDIQSIPLPPLPGHNIPGTNIPDQGVPEDEPLRPKTHTENTGVPLNPFSPPNPNIDPTMEKMQLPSDIDPPPNPNIENGTPFIPINVPLNSSSKSKCSG